MSRAALPTGFKTPTLAPWCSLRSTVHQLLADGHSVQATAAGLGLAGNTVRRFARAVNPEQLLVADGTGRRPSMLAEYAPYLHQRWNQGRTDPARLWWEIRARGYEGGYSLVGDYLALSSAGAPRAVAGILRI